MSEVIHNEEVFTHTDEPETILTEAVLKVHSRCNLDCDYCYVYNLGDNSWRDQPMIMRDETIDSFGDKLAAYLGQRDQLSFQITFHGGEPLLAPPEFYKHAISRLRAKVGDKTVLQFAMQTNVMLLTEDHLDVFRRERVGLGISLDGNKEANDRHRRTKSNISSYYATLANIDRVRYDDRYHHLFRGILSVIDIRNDPVETYHTLRELQPPSIDFLLPHGNWQTLPYGLETDEARLKRPYGKWQAKVFDEWFPDETLMTRMRTFDSIINLLGGKRSNVESMGGNAESSLVVVETDGSYELVDTLKSTPGRVAKTGLNVYRNSLEEAQAFMTRKAQKLGITALAQTCQQCPVARQCGGGYAPHRYDTETLFDNRSVYCLDLATLIGHIYGRLNEESIVKKVQRLHGEQWGSAPPTMGVEWFDP